ncbi:DUF4296 domain-containing protein [uncultured Polaribacter sp.]|uniref:DUF4296 domain-containing protein n=1 Tax=uncultured Polaribacter sp. TaxID=174711 RepID=UPI0026325578|nr:DUF4296 domain-containing protein [uncultured Polaribacter sp.]
MKMLKEKELLLIDKMKLKTAFLLSFIFLVSCTSNTIFEKPKNLIPKDTMSLLLQEMMIASSAKFVKNIHKEKNVNYMPFVYNKFLIDSIRFETSNFYYMSKIDEYQKILVDAKKALEEKNKVFKDRKSRLDSIKKDSLDKAKKITMRLDSLKIVAKKRKNDSLKKLKLK